MRREPWIALCLLAVGALLVPAEPGGGVAGEQPRVLMALAAPHAATEAIRAWQARARGDLPDDADGRSRG
jgi:hypothetical protein